MRYTYFVAFAVGATIGSAVTWYISKKKYEQIVQEEIDSVKRVFACKKAGEEIAKGFEKGLREPDEEITNKLKNKVESVAKGKVDIIEYANKLNQEGYVDYSSKSGTEDRDLSPVVIPPEEFGEYFDYDKISFTYYKDHILVDENDEIVEDVEGSIGFESLNHFGEYEDDSVFVRNDRLKVYYEILLDLRTYSEVIKSKPYLKEE